MGIGGCKKSKNRSKPTSPGLLMFFSETKKGERAMKKIFVAAVVGLSFILIGVFGIMEMQREQITRLQREVGWLQRDVHALDKKVFRNFSCLMAGGKLNKLSYQISERCIVEEVGNKNLEDWIEISKSMEHWGWQLVSVGVVGLDEEEGEKLLNLFKENVIGGEKVDAIFNPGPTVGIRFSFYPVETMRDFDLKKEKGGN